ncbi:phosphatidylinositol 4-phosphate 5-kinase 7 [Populus alba]|uniref:Phosphatidylinositol 4-phosphate 5-kinase n=1 Tax=Populus alba TaxID=43335 RepID=A0A4U5M9L8_POPAL|nr:phosphatidylinositol 4-phosphate 5-kinase 7-like [Populus alba]XP_034910744.1 phosphatidylinositol 4-phosphate 5-kinase 7-like [Populus alba]XP_034910746.1 phosphatidylinositol 4-phosphate 5-kinase 7-like [Populus alba]XP_034910747.1 phosphatidylinositol 4-phosphate 5-kinase 7-like [Populus alba]XP_034910748.1 phosphatidylinositol 4-phosphate 5-kinase 7-like [Populus alba]TKR65731.1 phosphatidylinositol 4-phosphate 5-kinase 7-like isoform X2 [Populus alba]
MVLLRHLLDIEDSESIDKKALSNGEVYIGIFKGTLPHGKGKYIWCDGTVYNGDWEEGKMTGKGQILWSSGAKYEGDFSGGYLHGIGTLIGHDGSEYKGAWRMNVRHGLGRKQYSNLDVYEGSWKEGMREGCGSYSWNSGNTYTGNWKGGKICGRGVMKWENGDLFDGFWINGLRHGSGVYRFADGGYYFGMWSMGLKDGKGTFYPAGTKHPSLRRWCSSLGCYESGRNLLSHSSSLNSEKTRALIPNDMRSLSERMSINGIFKDSGRFSQGTVSLDENSSHFSLGSEFICREPSCMLSQTSDEGQSGVQDNCTVVYEREYMQGVLKNEKVRNTEPSRKTKQRNKFHMKETKKKSYVDIFHGHWSYYLMLSLQLGIRYTVGKITPVPMRGVRDSDFGDRARIRMYFPRKGSQFTPPHYSIDFYWKDYCPMVFRNLREMFKLDAAEYMMSICGDDGLTELPSSGKSGSIFFLSHDDRFVIKTLKKFELKTVLKMLPKYYIHVGKHENTLITKIFGVHRITLRGGKKVRFVVMGNMFCTELRIHRRYDLKGSTQGRYTDKEKVGENTTLKDLDLAYEFHMDKLLRESLFKQLSLDCSFLESQQIIDYSLLLGIHFRAPEQLRAMLEPPATMRNHATLATFDGINSQGPLVIPPKGLLLVPHEPSSVSTAPGPHSRGNTLKANSHGEKEVDLLLPGTGRLRVQLGVNMPAQASQKLIQDEVDSAEIELFEVYDVVLYMGVIDILQEYKVKKKVEHACKSLKFDPQSISVVEPKLYAKRFINFLHKVFPQQP